MFQGSSDVCVRSGEDWMDVLRHWFLSAQLSSFLHVSRQYYGDRQAGWQAGRQTDRVRKK
ncbi:hypothetical protein E2C01_070421 [Portunus trituberculatus]|uniref:Uncharacterized protein n=1 Tax=Portunus trituberculatus TaxID=210409 RepID=A0A5B7HU37_PORTR|nr:hypothetical protein [Portunus trituberculatus]